MAVDVQESESRYEGTKLQVATVCSAVVLLCVMFNIRILADRNDGSQGTEGNHPREFNIRILVPSELMLRRQVVCSRLEERRLKAEGRPP